MKISSYFISINAKILTVGHKLFSCRCTYKHIEVNMRLCRRKKLKVFVKSSSKTPKANKRYPIKVIWDQKSIHGENRIIKNQIKSHKDTLAAFVQSMHIMLIDGYGDYSCMGREVAI